MRIPSLPALVLLLAACAGAPPLPPGVIVGEEMTSQDVVPFAVVDANPSAYFDRIVLVEATAQAVCQKVGCWMAVEDEGRTAMVRWESGCGGKYAFPASVVGKRVLIQGSFYPTTLSEDDAEHLASESSDALDVEAGDTYEFNASSVLVLES